MARKRKMSLWWEARISKFFKWEKGSCVVAVALAIAACQPTSIASCAADNVTRVAANGECLVIQTYGSPAEQNKLIVFIHGDGSSGGPSDVLYARAEHFASKGVISVGLIRPGYFDSAGNRSTGTSNRVEGDGYGRSIIDAVAAAVKALKDFYNAEHVVLVGHSGGAAISGVILGRYPDLADGAVLAACPCNVPKWRIMKRGQYNWTASLSPHAYADDVAKATKVIAVTGDNDSNTRPVIAAEYIELLKRNGIDATFFEAPSRDHNSVTWSNEFFDAIKTVLRTEKPGA